MRISFVVAAFSFATIFGAQPHPATAAAPMHASRALVSAIAAVADVASCIDLAHASPQAYVTKAFSFSSVRLNSGRRIVIATGADSCVCGNANCELVALRDDGGTYSVLLNEYQIREHFAADGTAQFDSHDSAMVSVRTKYAFDGKTYALVRRELYDEATHTAKLDPVPVAFAAGASSATVTGATAGLGYPDSYRVVANAGQTITATFVRKSRVASMSIFGNDTQLGTTTARTLSVKLPTSGAYLIEVDGTDSETFGTYALRIAIR